MSISFNSFFKENFVVYNPDTQCCSKDFSGLLTAKVIFIGEFHDTDVLERLKRETVLRLANSSTCVLLEGVAPGQVVVPKSDLFNHVTFLGSDVRFPMTLEVTTEVQAETCSEIEKSKQLVLDKFSNHKKSVKKQAEILNEALRNHEAVIHKKKKRIVVLPALLEEIRALEPKKVLQQFVSPPSTNEMDDSGIELKRANAGLFQEIKKAIHHYDRIIPIWGLSHFHWGEEMFSALKKAHITFIILQPNKQNMRQVMIEDQWRNDSYETVLLKLKQGSTLQIPKIFQHFFDPSIPFKSPATVKPQVFDSLKLFKTKSFKWPANIPIHLKEFSTDVLIQLNDEYGEGRNFKQTPATEMVVIESINQMLLLGNRRIKAIPKFERLDIRMSCPYFKMQHLEVLSSQKVTFKVLPNESIGTCAHLFHDMKRLGKKFKMKPGSWVVFLDITPKKLEKVLSDKTMTHFNKWLKSRAPENMRVVCKGQINTEQSTYTAITETTCLAISTDKGFRISLKPPKK